MKTYEKAPQSVYDLMTRLMMRHHQPLAAVGLKVDMVYAATDVAGAHAVTLHGCACYAVVRAVSTKDRSMGRGDAEILIDSEAYESMDEAQRAALIDHELYHLELKKDSNELPAYDSHGRPKLKMRAHDHEFGWFDEIARRHGEASIEVSQARALRRSVGQLYFDFAAEKVA